MRQDYDYLFAGGGCAALSLAWRLADPAFDGSRIVIIDPLPKTSDDRTWCYWTRDADPYPGLRHHSWDTAAVSGPGQHIRQPLSPWRYVHLRSADFYRHIQQQLDASNHFTYVRDYVTQTEDLPEGVRVHTRSSGSFMARWGFSSLPVRPAGTGIHLCQHFMGWRVRTWQPVFDPGCATLMDFHTPQQGQVRFMYVLPFSQTEALVECTIFSPASLPRSTYAHALDAYLRDRLRCGGYEVQETEWGEIPMTTYTYPQWQGPHMLSIGTAAGRTKPTTGYTFMPIQQEADAIAASLRQTGIPVPPPAREARFVFYDRLLLWLIRERGGDVHRILLDLFARNRMGDIFRFLDEKSSLGSDAWMLARLPWGPFMQALYACYMPQGTPYHPGTVHVPDHL